MLTFAYSTYKSPDFLCRPITKASTKDRTEIRRLAELQAKLEPRVRKAFLDAIEKLRGLIDEKKIARLLRANRVQEALYEVDQELLRAGFRPFVASVTGATITAGQEAARRILTPSSVEYVFGVTNPSTVEFLRRYEMGLIRGLSQEALAAVRQAITNGVSAGRNPLDVARDVRAFIGLTERQARAVLNYRAMLEGGGSGALERALRDRRFDSTINRALAGDITLKPEQIDQMVGRYQAKYLKYRSEIIARTESIRAVSAGNHQAWVQASEDGVVEADAVVRTWIFTSDDRTRDSHRAIPGMNPDGVGLNEPFESPLGPILYPGDPNASPENTIGCRCSVFLRYRPKD